MGHVLRMGERGGSRRRPFGTGLAAREAGSPQQALRVTVHLPVQALSCTVVHLLSEGTDGGVRTAGTRLVGLRESPSLRDTWEPWLLVSPGAIRQPFQLGPEPGQSKGVCQKGLWVVGSFQPGSYARGSGPTHALQAWTSPGPRLQADGCFVRMLHRRHA